MVIKLKINEQLLQKELKSFEKKLEKEILDSVKKLAKNTHEYIKNLAEKELKNTKDIYIKNLKGPEELSPGVHIITLTTGASFIETGKGFDMKPGLLKNAKQSKKTGIRYQVIPFKQDSADIYGSENKTASERSKKISEIIRKELKKREIPFEKIEYEKNNIRKPRLGKLHEFNVIEKIEKEKQILHKINIYQSSKEKGSVRRDILVFKTVTDSPKQKNKWIYPDKEGKKFFEKAEKFAINEWENKILPEILKKWQ